jgi:acyl-CoA synthetase (AMP-forming)/AMP-acid ligase II/acyl carrier protein
MYAAKSQLAGAASEHVPHASTLALLGVCIVFSRLKCQFAEMSAAESQLAGAAGEHVPLASTLTSASTLLIAKVKIKIEMPHKMMIPDVPNPQSVADIVQYRAQTQPDFDILIYLADGEQEEQRLTYAGFDRQAKLVAGYLQQQGLEGERVLLLFPQGLEYMIALFGCFYAGVIAVPAYPPRNNRNMLRIEAIIDNTGASAILADQSSADRMMKMSFDFSKQQLLAYEELIAADVDWAPRKIKKKEIAYLQYTSGSTGKPKGVIIRHENVLLNAHACRNIYPPDTKCAVNWIPMFHDMGLIYMMSYLLQNAQCYFMSPVHFVQKPIRWLDAVSRYKADYTVAPNFAFDLCCEKIKEEQLEGLDLSHLRSVLSGSERVQLKTMLDFTEKFGRVGFQLEAFKPGYGLAEATLAVSYVTHDGLPYLTPKSDLSKRKPLSSRSEYDRPQEYHVSIGPPVEGCTVRIVDPETRTALPEGQEGEVWASFEGSIATGYWRNETASEETFQNTLETDPGLRFLRTGDLGFMLGGEVYITGRIKDMIIIRGQNYYPNDIEFEVAQAHPALQQNSGAAFSIDVEGTERLAIVHEVKRAEWRAADPDAVIDAIRQGLSEAFDITPYRIVLIFPMSVPKTSSGKVQRQRAKQLLLNDELRVMKAWTFEPKEDGQEEVVLASVSAELILSWLCSRIARRASMPVEQVTPNSAFEAFPLESVDAAELSEELSQQLGFTVEAESFWAMPNLHALAEYLYEQYQAAKA